MTFRIREIRLGVKFGMPGLMTYVVNNAHVVCEETEILALEILYAFKKVVPLVQHRVLLRIQWSAKEGVQKSLIAAVRGTKNIELMHHV
mmetsp:Transcript_14958/g.39552  ORF Transcript_14958/g.39552 Transcript_14958/m.39552 type:complete len:89 (+) Transcript_14958:525-791(+)